MIIYVNGFPVATGLVGELVVADAGKPLLIGAASGGFAAFDGLIGEVAIYNGALSARRVARHFAVGQQVLSDPAHYRLVDPPTYA